MFFWKLENLAQLHIGNCPGLGLQQPIDPGWELQQPIELPIAQAASAAGSWAGPGPGPDRLGLKCYLAWGGTRVVGWGGGKGGGKSIANPTSGPLFPCGGLI
jgi:hypothetical protein